jgi:hypothetical protein
MAQKIASLYADIGAKTQGFEKGAASVKSGLLSLAKQFVVSGAAAAAFGEALRFSIKQAADGEKEQAALSAAIASTGGAAGLSADELNRMGLSMSRLSTFSDGAITESQTLLLTFTRIGKEVFPQAQQAILDVATLMGGDLKTATIQVGKALNDPIAGLASLSRVGIQFSDDQKEMIKTMMEMGDVTGAQNVILGELTTQFGGQAAAAANTYHGEVQQLKNEMEILGGVIGDDVLPDLKDFVVATKEAVIWTSANYEAIKKWIDGFNRLNILYQARVAVTDAIKSNKDYTESVEDNAEALEELYGKRRHYTDAEIAAAMAITETRKAVDGQAESVENLASALVDAEEAQKAMSDSNKTFLSTLENMQDKSEAFASSYESINSDMSLTDEERKAKLKELSDEYEMQNRRIILGLLERKLMEDGMLTDDELNWLLEKGLAWGIYSQSVIDETRAAMAEVNALTDMINNIPTDRSFTLHMGTTGNIPAMADPNRTYYGGGRAGGGDVRAGTAYMVGERGREMFVPNADGKIVPNQNLSSNQQQKQLDTESIIAAIERNRLDEDTLGRVIINAMVRDAK